MCGHDSMPPLSEEKLAELLAKGERTKPRLVHRNSELEIIEGARYAGSFFDDLANMPLRADEITDEQIRESEIDPRALAQRHAVPIGNRYAMCPNPDCSLFGTVVPIGEHGTHMICAKCESESKVRRA